MTQQERDAGFPAGQQSNPHHYLLLMREDESAAVDITCDSEADVHIWQIRGLHIQELIGGDINLSSGPLVIDCEKHGKYLGLFHVLPTGEMTDSGAAFASMPLVMIPLQNVEYAMPLRTGQDVPGAVRQVYTKLGE